MDNMDIKASGVKFDGDKSAMDLVRPEFSLALGVLCAKGAAKYKRRNWEMGMRWGRVFAAMQRHANAFWSGEMYDEEGNHHLIAVAWNAMVLWWYSITKRYQAFDDRKDIPGDNTAKAPQVETMKPVFSAEDVLRRHGTPMKTFPEFNVQPHRRIEATD